ncbi:MAG: recombination regulator RecX, partial [Acidovorax sp.]
VDARERGRQGRFLLTRGFSGDVVHRVLRGDVPDDSAANP